MKIHFDLVHASDVNLYKHSIRILKDEGHEIFITLRTRGNLYNIAKSELIDNEIKIIGTHQKHFISKLFALVAREYSLYNFLKQNKIQLSLNQGFSNIISCKILKIPFIVFEDDFEYKMAFYYAKLLATRDIMPVYIPSKGKNVYKYKGFKELAYLHPKIFFSNPDVLKELHIIQFKYVFIREIANISLNYSNRISFLAEIINHIYDSGLQIVLSLEDKSISDQFNNKCIILQEPLPDIYSLMSNALFSISSGDTMAREACLLSTPCIYTGGREMIMNLPLIEKGIMFKLDKIEDITDKIQFLVEEDNANKIRVITNKIVGEEWEYTTDVILKHILHYDI